MPSKQRRCAATYKSPPPLFLAALMVSRNRSSLLGSACASFTSQESWKVAIDAPQTLCGLLRCIGWDARWPSPTSPCCITCRMGRRVSLSGKNCWCPRHPTTTAWASQALSTAASLFRCTRDRSAWCYRGCGPRSCLTGQHWTAGCPMAGKPIGAQYCTRQYVIVLCLLEF